MIDDGFPTLSLDQPYASLCVTRRETHIIPDGIHDQRDYGRAVPGEAWKWIETRSWPCPPALIGQPLRIHATRKMPRSSLRVGPFHVRGFGRTGLALNGPGLPEFRSTPRLEGFMLPLGRIVGTVTVVGCVPMTHGHDEPPVAHLALTTSGLTLCHDYHQRDVTDQFPFGVFERGRFAWLFTNAAPTTERCPHCGGAGLVTEMFEHDGQTRFRCPTECPTCEGRGRCHPVAWRGRQRVWRWRP